MLGLHLWEIYSTGKCMICNVMQLLVTCRRFIFIIRPIVYAGSTHVLLTVVSYTAGCSSRRTACFICAHVILALFSSFVSCLRSCFVSVIIASQAASQLTSFIFVKDNWRARTRQKDDPWRGFSFFSWRGGVFRPPKMSKRMHLGISLRETM